MSPLKPYLLRSVYEWIIDNELTPHLLVDANDSRAVIPRQFVDKGRIVLNIRPQAIQGLSLGNEEVHFNARFSGKPMHITIPTSAVLAIYAKENGKGMIFDPDDDNADEAPPPEPTPPNKPQLRIVK